MRVVLFGDYPSLQEGRLREMLGPEFEIVALADAAPSGDIAAAFEVAEIIVSNRWDADLPPAPRLRFLQSPSAGLEKIDLGSVPPQALVAAGTGHEIPMAEYVLCAMLDHAIGFRTFASSFENGRWSMRHWIKGPVHDELFERSLGLLGYGSIAREVAKRAKAFGMRVRALSRWSSGGSGDEHVDEAFVLGGRDAFLQGLDYLLVTVPLSPETRGYIDEDWFSVMSPRTVIINVGRGPVIEETSLYQALRDRRIAGAVLDVWYRYPRDEVELVTPSDLPFHELENVVMTPHGSGRTRNTFARRWFRIVENIRSVSAGKQPQDLVRRH